MDLVRDRRVMGFMQAGVRLIIPIIAIPVIAGRNSRL